ncbi:hypothetical protein [Candidatus Nitrospira bockiana]
MKCLDHIDMAVMAGAVTVAASTAFFFAHLGVEQPLLTPPTVMTSEKFLEQELARTIEEAVVTPALVTEAHERAQAALGAAIVRLSQVQARTAAFIPAVAGSAALDVEARRDFLEGVFKLPADWRGAEFAARKQQADAIAQEDLGRAIVTGSQDLERALEAAEAEYGSALVAAAKANERAALEPRASQATIIAAATALTALAERIAFTPAAEITPDPAWGHGSIGDGAIIPLMILGAGALLFAAAGAGMMTERGASTRTVETHCDVHEKDVVVDMLVSDDRPYEVIRCSAFNGGPMTCDKHCLKLAVLQAA